MSNFFARREREMKGRCDLRLMIGQKLPQIRADLVQIVVLKMRWKTNDEIPARCRNQPRKEQGRRSRVEEDIRIPREPLRYVARGPPDLAGGNRFAARHEHQLLCR